MKRFVQRLLLIASLMPLALVSLAWGTSYTEFTAELYDNKRGELWMLHRGTIYLHQQFSEVPAPPGQFHFDLCYQDEPFSPEYQLSLWYPTIAAGLIALIPAGGPMVAAWRRWVQGRKHRCPRCGHDLTGNVSRVCPECGKPV